MRLCTYIPHAFLSAVIVTTQFPAEAEEKVNLTQNIQSQMQSSVEHIQVAVKNIMFMPKEKQTFESTLKAWYDITLEIQGIFSLVYDQMSTFPPDMAELWESFLEYQSFIRTIHSHQAEIYYSLFSHTKKALFENSLRNLFQIQIVHQIALSCEQFREAMPWEDQRILDMLIGLHVQKGMPNPNRIAKLDRKSLGFEKTGGILLVADIESSAWDKFMNDPDVQTQLDALKEAALAIGSAMAGDMQGALEHGIAALEKEWNFYKDLHAHQIEKEVNKKAKNAEHANAIREERYQALREQWLNEVGERSLGTIEHSADRDCGKR